MENSLFALIVFVSQWVLLHSNMSAQSTSSMHEEIHKGWVSPLVSFSPDGFESGVELDFPRLGRKSWVFEITSALNTHEIERNLYLTYETSQDIPLLNPERVSGVSWQSYRVKLSTRKIVELSLGRKRWSKSGRTFLRFSGDYSWMKLKSQTASSPMPLHGGSFLSGPNDTGQFFEDFAYWWPKYVSFNPDFIVAVSQQTAIRPSDVESNSVNAHLAGVTIGAGWRLIKNQKWSPILSYQINTQYNFGKNNVSPSAPPGHEHRALDNLYVSRFRVTQQVRLGIAIAR